MSDRKRRIAFLEWCGAAMCAVLPFTEAVAQSYPIKPIRIFVGFAAGSSATDMAARMLAQKLSDQLGQPVIVENRAGSGGIIATELVAKSAPDGYTLLMMAAADSIQPAIRAKMPYDMPHDFSPISLVVSGPFVLVVHPSVPANTVKDLIALARARPGQMHYASSGVGSSAHLAAELFNSLAHIKTIHVPYKGSSQTVVATANGEVDMVIVSITGARPLIEAGKLRVLAVSTAKRTALMPSVPTIHESGVAGYARTGWYGLIGPAGIPKEIVGKLNATIVQVVNVPDMKAAFFRQGLESDTNTPEQFTEMIRREVDQNIKLTRAAGIKPE